MKNPVEIKLENVTVRFPLSYSRVFTLRDNLASIALRILGRSKPQEMFTALKGINLHIQQNEIVGIIGPNGCGKSTLLRTISGIYHPDEGNLSTTGKLSVLLSLGTGFNNKLSAVDNIRMNGLLLGMNLEDIEAKLDDIIGFAEIGKFKDVPMKYYSSGMISRVSFAILLAMNPDIILIDEVFSVGDLVFQKKSESVMHQLLQQASAQVIVTHNLELVRDYCTRGIYIKQGQVVADGHPDEVVDQYIAESEQYLESADLPEVVQRQAG